MKRSARLKRYVTISVSVFRIFSTRTFRSYLSICLCAGGIRAERALSNRKRYYLCMPPVIPKHVAIRSDLRETVKVAAALNECLESVIGVKARGSSEVFHGKVDHSQPPWSAPPANMILELHSWVRETEALWRYRMKFPPRFRGGSDKNTYVCLKTLTGLAEGIDDSLVSTADRWLNGWCKRAKATLGVTESAKRLPRVPGEGVALCPWCKHDTLREMALAGVIFCIDPGCADEENRRPKAYLEYFQGEMVLRWQDGIIGAP